MPKTSFVPQCQPRVARRRANLKAAGAGRELEHFSYTITTTSKPLACHARFAEVASQMCVTPDANLSSKKSPRRRTHGRLDPGRLELQPGRPAGTPSKMWTLAPCCAESWTPTAIPTWRAQIRIDGPLPSSS